MVKRCTRMLAPNGIDEVPAEGERWEAVDRMINALSAQGQRVMAVCRTQLNSIRGLGADLDPAMLPLDDLCYLGLVGLVDPPREEVPHVIEQCAAAGVKVIMVTGDHPNTALAIAQMVGIVTSDTLDTPDTFSGSPDSEAKPPSASETPETPKLASCPNGPDGTPPDRVDGLAASDATAVPVAAAGSPDSAGAPKMTAFAAAMAAAGSRAIVVPGTDIPEFESAHWDWVFAHRDLVFARTTPQQKLRIVKEAQERGYTVAVTGDGVNDSPALRQADIGVCMGSGSEIAREAADIVLLDDNFSSILVGIENGRLLFENLQKVILYLLPAGTWSELLPVLASVFLGVPMPLSTFLMVYICVGTDMAPSLSLIKEHAESELMQQPPRDRRATHLVNGRMLVYAYFYKGMIISIAGFTMYFWYMYAYAGMSMGDLFLAFNAWSDGYKGYSQSQLNEFLYTAQSVYFLTLVELQFGNLMSTRTRYRSFFQQNPLVRPTRNLSLFVAIVIELTLAILMLLVPFLNNIFNTRPPPVQFWFAPLAFSATLFIIDEARKYSVRRWPTIWIARIMW